jgi:DNA (cytosine-5)-methyltransferase 1
MKITLLDLFSGIGGFHLGLEKAGFEVESYFSEIDKYAIDVYSNNFKNSTYVGSVTTINSEQLPRIDAITFGSPCQDFSLAGKRKGMGGERSSLITEAIRLIEECRPRFFIWENVKGTFSSNNRQDFAAILQAFANIGGYRLEWQLLNTKWFLPQNRERIYLVGYIGDGSRGQVFPIGGNKWRRERMSYRDIDRANTCTLTTRYGADRKREVTCTECKFDEQKIKVNSATSTGYEEATVGDSINLSVPTSKTRRGRVGKGVAQTLDTHCNQAVIGDFRYDEGYRERKDGNSPCLATRKSRAETGYISTMPPIVNRIRRLTPIECERLQGFPDNWTAIGKEKGQISDSQRYKMCGNAVTVDVVAAVAENLKKVL